MIATLMAASMVIPAPQAEVTVEPHQAAVCVRREFMQPDGSKAAGLGSGVVVAHEAGWSLILTNNHVCPEVGKTVKVGHNWKRYDAWVACSDKDLDLAALMVRAPLPAARIATDKPKAGAELWQYGFGLQLPCRKSGKATDNYQTAQGRPTHFTTIDTESGDSGSGVIDARGHVVGVTWGSGGAVVELDAVRRFTERVARESKMFPALAKELR